MLTSSSRLRAAVLLLLLAGPLAGEEPPMVPFAMPTPDGWRTETIPFPLAFAPELTYEGLEELRFSPGMFERGSDDFWTYAFVWWLPLETRLGAESLASDLEIYFRGLTRAVSEARKFETGELEFRTVLRETPATAKDFRWLVGEAVTFDAFTTREQIELNVSIHIWPCEQQERQVAFFELSPQATSHPVWRALGGIREGFRCEPIPRNP